MVKYSLIARNIVTGKMTVLWKNQDLINIDRMIYSSFNNEEEVVKSYNLSLDNKLHIMYMYQNIVRYLALIYHNNRTNDFGQILAHTKDNQICGDYFINYIDKFITSFNDKQLQFLYDNKYIDYRVYSDLIQYTYGNDQKEIIYGIKKKMGRYAAFRKLYIGLYQFKYGKPLKQDSQIQKKIIKTDDDLLNSLYNNGDLDSVYSVYDIDQLSAIDKDKQLDIDALKTRR